VCILSAGSVSAQAEDAELLRVPPSWRIAPEVSHYRYREPGVMELEGTYYGIVGSYTWYKLRDRHEMAVGTGGGPSGSWTTARLEGRLSSGRVDYDGAYMDGTPVSISNIEDWLVNVKGLWGIEWHPAQPLNALYVGLGYRYLSNDTSFHPAGYLRESNYFYVPIGARRDLDLSGGWELGVTGEFNALIIGRQISHLDDVDPSLPKVRNWQWPGYGATASLELRRRFDRFDLALAPFLRYWWIAESAESDGFVEPENNTLEYGVSFVVRF
jgi:hypothetical protein